MRSAIADYQESQAFTLRIVAPCCCLLATILDRTRIEATRKPLPRSSPTKSPTGKHYHVTKNFHNRGPRQQGFHFENGPSGASVQRFVRRVHCASYDVRSVPLMVWESKRNRQSSNRSLMIHDLLSCTQQQSPPLTQTVLFRATAMVVVIG
jgi:hypothetical protein